ncbi:MAG TPA: class I SAM-dependent DNA methyltransferase, partial [Candidatus Sumerlaeota bacterium]|nr:class I SAM-dependent DNA methyltransferase [Candidatus Sumerlaeota bacterium]
WPARIAETALWLTDHQMNTELSLATGNLFQRIPLRAAPHIRCANALRMDWNELIPAKECSCILGNPPFVGAKYQTSEQKEDVKHVAGQMNNSGLLDYVAMWYFKAADYIRGGDIRCAFVSTNSISQGEQVGVLWSELFNRGVKIHFAHRTFAWQSEARGKAHVHVVIIGFGMNDKPGKTIYEYDTLNGNPSAIAVINIAPYLIEGANITINNRSKPICNAPEIGIGNKPIDGGNYLFETQEKDDFVMKEPGAATYFRPWIGSEEFLHGKHRWCLWLGDASPQEIARLPECKKRIQAVQQFRFSSKSAPTRKLAETPRRFHVENFPKGEYLVLPEVSSEKRPYIPIGYLSPPTLCSNLVKIIPNANIYHFGILTSAMHMAWVRQVCGRLESRYRYSAKLVYNNYPWPVDATAEQREKVAECARDVLDVRQDYLTKGATLADLYDPLTMPPPLLMAHHALDRAVDRCYRPRKFNSERERVEFLFGLYEKITTPLAPIAPLKKTRGAQ